MPLHYIKIVVAVLWIRIGFNADPDPAFFVNADPDPAFFQCGSGSRVLITKNWKKFTAEKLIIFVDQKLQFTYPKASKKDVQATEKSASLKREHPALQN